MAGRTLDLSLALKRFFAQASSAHGDSDHDAQEDLHHLSGKVTTVCNQNDVASEELTMQGLAVPSLQSGGIRGLQSHLGLESRPRYLLTADGSESLQGLPGPPQCAPT